MKLKKMGEFKEYGKWITCLEENGYTKAEAKSAAEKILSMDQDIKAALIQWMEDGIIENVVVEGFDVCGLMEHMGFSAIASFLLLDWLKRNPNEAKTALGGILDRVIVSDELLEEINALDMEKEPEDDGI